MSPDRIEAATETELRSELYRLDSDYLMFYKARHEQGSEDALRALMALMGPIRAELNHRVAALNNAAPELRDQLERATEFIEELLKNDAFDGIFVQGKDEIASIEANVAGWKKLIARAKGVQS